jgi:hypothetical protein
MVDLEQFRRSNLSASTFAQRAFREMEGLSAKDYWNRPKRSGAKKLIEEVLPLAMIVKYLDIPGRRVRCRYLGQSDDTCDGLVTISGQWVNNGWLESQYFIEVTSAQFPNEHLKREALARYGSVFEDPGIHRVGSKRKGNDRIVSSAVAQDGDAVVTAAAEWIAEAVDKKAGRSYPKPCCLVIALEPERPLYLAEWLTLVQSFPRDLVKGDFAFTFLVHTGAGDVHHAG